MTKRILAAVLALVMSLSILAVPAFAAGSSNTVNLATDGNKITATWAKVTDAASYTVKVFSATGQVASGTVAASAETTYTYTYTATAAGTYTFEVSALYGNGATITTMSNSIGVAYTQTAGKLTFVRGADKSVTVSWTADEKATNGYYVSYTVSGKSTVETTTSATSITISGVDATATVSVTVWYNTEATLKAGSIGSGTLTATGATTGGTTGGTTGTNTSGNVQVNGRVMSWTPINVAGVTYIVKYYYSGSNTPSTIPVTGTSVTVPNGVTKAEVYAVLGASTNIPVGTATFATTGATGGVTVTPGTRTVVWTAVPGVTSYSIYINNMPTVYKQVSTTYFTAQSGITSVTVKYLAGGQYVTIGTVTLPYSGNASGSTGNNVVGGSENYFTSNGLTVAKGTSYSTVTWTADPAATGYLVTYKNLNTNAEETRFTATNAIQLPFSYNDKWYVSVDKWVNGIKTTIGYTTVYPTGTNVGGTTTGTTTTTGTNCTVVSTASASTLTWNSTGAAWYKVYYIVDGQSQATTVTGTSVIIPVGNTSAFTVIVVDSNNTTIAYADVKKATNTGSTNVGNATTVIKNLKLTPKNSWQTTVSWDAVSGAMAYLIMYAPYGSNGTTDTSSLTTSCDIPYGPGSNYVVYVYAILANGGTKMVGEATHIAGSEGSTAEPEDDAADYVTNLKGVAGESKKIKLSWTAAKDAEKYTIYYKRSANSEWIKAGSTSKCAVNITGLTNGVSYDFKVVANGNDSGILTIKPSTTSKTVIAEDPEDVETVTAVPEITSATSSKSGTATIKWSKVEGATSYKVYFAEEGSNTYRSKATVSTNSCTITGLDDGSYKVRVKALVDGEWTALADCTYVSVNVK